MAKVRTKSSSSTDAIAILTADHNKVKKLFKQFESRHENEADNEAEQVARQICAELTIHATVEEEIFYPAVRAAIDDEDLLNEAEVEHVSAKELIAQIESSDASDEKYAAKVMVLGEYINHHVQEEQGEMFPKAKKAKLDMEALGEEILQRKKELTTEMGIDDETEDAEANKRASRGKGHVAQRNGAARR